MNLDCTKLNRCLKELDSLERVELDRDAEGGLGTLTLKFGSPMGGEYEDVELQMIFTEPITYHLPNYRPDTQFAVHLCEEREALELLPDPERYSEYEVIVRFSMNDSISAFYVHADRLYWKLTGLGPIKNEHEFIGYEAEDIPEPYEGYSDDIQTSIQMLIETFDTAYDIVKENPKYSEMLKRQEEFERDKDDKEN